MYDITSYRNIVMGEAHKTKKVEDRHFITQEDLMAEEEIIDSNLYVCDEDEAEKRVMRTCIIPMPLMESFTIDDEAVKGRTDCNCEYIRSIRCIRLHIMEERYKLFKTLGLRNSTNWGLPTKDEHLFHKVAYNNPTSSNKNFWNYLSIVFPSRSIKEISTLFVKMILLSITTMIIILEDFEEDFVKDETCAANGLEDHTKRNIDPVEMHHPNENPPI
ncbi:hypothetical protein RYX36_002958, partial [Vicia faba]